MLLVKEEIFMQYTIIDDTRYADRIRIKTMWREGRNRYLWVYTKDLDDFAANPDSFKVTTSLFETDAKWWHPGRKKYGSNGKILKWQSLIVKKSRISTGVKWFAILSAAALLLGSSALDAIIKIIFLRGEQIFIMLKRSALNAIITIIFQWMGSKW